MKLIKIIKFIKKRVYNTRLSSRLKLFGENTNIHPSVEIHYPQNVEIYDYVHLGPGVYINGKGRVTIRKGAVIAPNVRILTSNHNYKVDIKSLPYDNIDLTYHCIIGEGAWICDSSMILPNVKIGKGAIVGAGAIVTKDVPDYGIVGGNPAKIIKYRDSMQIGYLIDSEKFYLSMDYKSKEQLFHE